MLNEAFSVIFKHRNIGGIVVQSSRKVNFARFLLNACLFQYLFVSCWVDVKTTVQKSLLVMGNCHKFGSSGTKQRSFVTPYTLSEKDNFCRKLCREEQNSSDDKLLSEHYSDSISLTVKYFFPRLLTLCMCGQTFFKVGTFFTSW